MQKEIIQKIEMLVEMSDTNNHYESLEEELGILKVDIAKQKDTLRDLKKSMVDGKYIKASDRLIDENIKIGLENKIANDQERLNEVKSQVHSISKEEEEYHTLTLELESEMATSKKFLDSLELKLKTIGSKDKSAYTFYEELIDTTTKDIKEIESKLQVKRKAYEQVEKRLESYGTIRNELEESIEAYTEKLEETKSSLENQNAYVDVRAKQKDEEQVQTFNKNLETLEKRQLEIITDPAYIGHDAINLLLEENKPGVLSKVKELVTIVNARPFMDFHNNELDEILEDAIQKRDEFANIIENKRYDSIENTVLNNRITFLKSCQEKKHEEKRMLEQKIRELDIDTVRDVMAFISDAKSTREQLRKDIEDYKAVMEENNEYKTPKKKASLNAAFHRKCDELEQINTIIANYEKDLENIVSKSKKLEEKELTQINDDLNNIEEEIKTIEKKKLYNNYPKDILAIEKDKSELKKLSDEVEQIVHRQKYLKTPNEILDEIEVSLNSSETENESLEKNEEFINLNDYRIDAQPDLEETKALNDEKVIFSNIEEKSQNVSSQNAIKNPKLPDQAVIEPITDLNNLKSSLDDEKEIELEEFNFPPRTTYEPIKNKDNRLKVIRVEPIEETNSKEQLQDDDYMVNDFEDTDYISFNDLLERSMNSED